MPQSYHPCAVCPRNRLFVGKRHQGGVVVPPDGPQPNRILFVGEGPAKEEEATRRPFMGVTGTEFNEQYLPISYLERAEIRVANAVLCSLPGHRNPTKEEGQACMRSHLPAEILRTRPSIIVPMGAVACSNLCPDLPLNLEYGLPTDDYHIPWLDWTGTIVPMYHPAAGLYDQRFAVMIVEAFRNLRLILRGEYERPTDVFVGREDYDLIKTGRDLDDYIGQHYGVTDIALDTEYDPRKNNLPHCVSFSLAPGTGRMILASNTHVLRSFADYLDRYDRYLFHNILADHGVLRRMRVPLPWSRCYDSMIDAYNLGLPFIGLKPLAYRHCGVQMEDYSDLVEPYQLAASLGYMRRIVKHGESTPFRDLQPWLGKRQHTVDRKARACITNVLTKDSNPIQVWEGWPYEDRDLVTGLLGPFPTLGVASAPLDRQIVYSCRDSDVTLRLSPILHRHMATLRNEINA